MERDEFYSAIEKREADINTMYSNGMIDLKTKGELDGLTEESVRRYNSILINSLNREITLARADESYKKLNNNHNQISECLADCTLNLSVLLHNLESRRRELGDKKNIGE
jgi:hypothetical protein